MPDQLSGLLEAGIGRENEAGDNLLYGTDFPYMNKEVLVGLAAELDDGLVSLFQGKGETLNAIYKENSGRLLGL